MKKTNKHQWNLRLLYASEHDPKIEADFHLIEKKIDAFAKKYDTPKKRYLADPQELLKALSDYENILAIADGKPLFYFHYRQHMDSEDASANQQVSLLSNRLTKAINKIQFFTISIGKIPKKLQKDFLSDQQLAYFRVFLKQTFDDASRTLSEVEEKIMSLKHLPAYSFWVKGNEKLLGGRSVKWKGKEMPLTEAYNLVSSLEKARDRTTLGLLIDREFKEVSVFAESELNAIVTNKKIDDELRGYENAYDSTIQSYRNDPSTVLDLVDTVTKHFSISQRYYRLKAKIMGKKKLSYFDRAAKTGSISQAFSIDDCIATVRDAFGSIDQKYVRILDAFLENGQIDWKPRQGKHGGGYCSSSYGNPTFVFLNHTDNLDSFKTFAHEMGHAFHAELCERQGPIYSMVSMSLAETASTLFEQIAFEAIFEKLSEKEKVTALEQKLNSDVATIFRQVACFNFEKDIHEGIRTKGFLTAKELAGLHNKNMQSYLGPVFEIEDDAGYAFVSWPHLRYFFYVYSYAYGMLVSKALLRRYKQDKSFWKKIEQFLSAGGKDSPENILREIGIDVRKPDFWKEGLKEIDDDILKLEELTKK